MIEVRLVSKPFASCWWRHPVYIARRVSGNPWLSYLRIGPILIFVAPR